MLWGQKLLRVTAALGVAFAAAHTAERLKGPAVEQSLLISAAKLVNQDRTVTPQAETAVPKSASLSSPAPSGMNDLVGITSVAATTPDARGDHCRPVVQLAAMTGAMIHLSLAAPCNRSERIVVRHSGLSFSAQTSADGRTTAVFPALKTDAMVAVYLQDAQLVLGKVIVPDAVAYSRFALMWELPVDLELRVTDGDKVLVGGTIPGLGTDQQVIALGVQSGQSPMLARVYSVPGADLGDAEITGELRITPTSCGRTLRLDTVVSTKGTAKAEQRMITVPLCGMAGDILVLKNLAPALKIAAPK